MILKILQKIDSVKLFDKYIKSGKLNKLYSLNEDDMRKFITWYLGHEYNQIENKDILPYYLKISARVIPLEELDNLLIEAPYFKSMPDYEVKKFLANSSLNLNALPLFKIFLTKKLANFSSYIVALNRGLDVDKDLIFRELVECKNIDILVGHAVNLVNNDHREELLRYVVKSNDYTIENIATYISLCKIKANLIIDIFADLYKRDRVKALNTLISLAYLRTPDDEVYYKDLIYELANNKKWTSIMKSDFAKMLLEKEEYKIIYYWFYNHIESSYNHNLITDLMTKSSTIVAEIIDDKYLEFAVMKVIKRGDKFIGEFINSFMIIFQVIDTNRIDRILEIIYHVNYDFKLSKDIALKLIKVGSKYTSKYLFEYDFDENERKNILMYNKDDSDFLSLYGAYLHTGDKTKLIDQNIANSKLDEMVKARKKKK